MKLSESIDNRDMDVQPTKDQLALARIKKLALRRAGFAPRRIGRRTLIALIAALAALFVFTTSLALTDMGAKLADMFRDYAGIKDTLDVLGIHGSAIGAEVTDNDITVRVDAAYADDGLNILAISVRDALGRFTEGMGFHPYIGSYSGYWHSPSKGADGAMHMLLVFKRTEATADQKLQLLIDEIVPGESKFSEEDLGLSLDDALARIDPLAVQDLPGVTFVDARFEADGLAITFDVSQDSDVRIDEVILRYPDGTRALHDVRDFVFGEQGEADAYRDTFGFSGVSDTEGIRGARLLLNYTRFDEPIVGNWRINFRMPSSSGTAHEVMLDTPLTIADSDFYISGAKLYPSCITLNFRAVNDTLPSQEPAGAYIGFVEEQPWPKFKIVADDGEVIEGNWVDGKGEWRGETYYTAVFPCATDQYSALTLVILDGRDDTVLFELPLK